MKLIVEISSKEMEKYLTPLYLHEYVSMVNLWTYNPIISKLRLRMEVQLNTSHHFRLNRCHLGLIYDFYVKAPLINRDCQWQ